MPISFKSANAKFEEFVSKNADVDQNKTKYFLKAKGLPETIAKFLAENKMIGKWLAKPSAKFVEKFNQNRVANIAETTHLKFEKVNAIAQTIVNKNKTVIPDTHVINNTHKYLLFKKIEMMQKVKENIPSLLYGLNILLKGKPNRAQNQIIDALEKIQKMEPVDDDVLKTLYKCAKHQNPAQAICKELFPAFLKGKGAQIKKDFLPLHPPIEFYSKSPKEQIRDILNFHNEIPAEFLDKLDIPDYKDKDFKKKYQNIVQVPDVCRNGLEHVLNTGWNKNNGLILEALVRTKDDNYANFGEVLETLIYGESSQSYTTEQKQLWNHIAPETDRDPKLFHKLVECCPDLQKYNLKNDVFPAYNRVLKLSDEQIKEMSSKDLAENIEKYSQLIKVQRQENLKSETEARWFINLGISDPLSKELFIKFLEVGLCDGEEKERGDFMKAYLKAAKECKENGFSDASISVAVGHDLLDKIGKEPDCLKWKASKELPKELQNPIGPIQSKIIQEQYRKDWEARLGKIAGEGKESLVQEFIKEFGCGVPCPTNIIGWEAGDTLIRLFEKAVAFAELNKDYSNDVIIGALRNVFLHQIDLSENQDGDAVKTIAGKIGNKELTKEATLMEMRVMVKKEVLGDFSERVVGMLSRQIQDLSVPINKLGKERLGILVKFVGNLYRNEKWTSVEIERKFASVLREFSLNDLKSIHKLNTESNDSFVASFSSLENMMKTEDKISLAKVRDILKKDPEKGLGGILRQLNAHLVGSDSEPEPLKNINKKEAQDGVSRIFRKLFPDTILGISGVLQLRGDNPVTVPVADSIPKIIESFKNYTGHVADRIELDKLPWNDQLVQQIVPTLIRTIKDARGQVNIKAEKQTAFTKLVVEDFPGLINPNPLVKIFLSAIGKYPNVISKIAKFFEKPIIKVAGKFFSAKVEEAKIEAKKYEGLKGPVEKEEDFMAQMSLGVFEILDSSHEALIKLMIRALPKLVENHDIRVHIPLLKMIHEAVTSTDEPDWNALQAELIKSLVILTGEIAQYDGMLTDIVRELADLGRE